MVIFMKKYFMNMTALLFEKRLIYKKKQSII